MDFISIPVLAMIFSTFFTLVVLYLLLYWVPRRNASLFLTIASRYATQYGTGPTLDVGDELKAFKRWKYQEIMQQLLHLKHKIYLESEILDHHRTGADATQTDGPSAAQQAIAMSIASELRNLESSIRKKGKDGALSWFRMMLWSVIGVILYGLIFGGIVALFPQEWGNDPMHTLAPVFLVGAAVVLLLSAYFSCRSWSDYHTIRTIEADLEQMKEDARPFLAFNGLHIDNSDQA